MVPKAVPPEEVINIFKKFGLNVVSETYYKIDNLIEEFNLYSTKAHCDCGSIISKLQDERCNSFDEYKLKKKGEDLEKLNNMKTLKDRYDYETTLNDYMNERNRLWNIVNSFKPYIQKFQMEEYERIKKLNIEKAEKVKMIDEMLRSKHGDSEKNQEYQKASKTYRDFLKGNSDLEESIDYDIEKNESVIADYKFEDFYEEYNDIKSAFTEILKLTKEICVYPFYQDNEKMVIVERRQVRIDSLEIDNLTFLPYRSLLVVSKR
jgi:hypothetical protein